MRLFKEEKEFVEREVGKKFDPILKDIFTKTKQAIEKAILNIPMVDTFVKMAKEFTVKPEIVVNTWVGYCKINVQGQDHCHCCSAMLTLQLPGFHCNTSWCAQANAGNFPDIFLNVPLKTKTPKDEDERFVVLQQIIDEIGQEIVKREQAGFEYDLEVIKNLDLETIKNLEQY